MSLLNPCGLPAGVVSLSMPVMPGAVFLQMRTEDEFQDRTEMAMKISGIVFMAAFGLAGVILTAGFALLPFVIPSSTALSSCLTIDDAVSSHRTLNLMACVAVLSRVSNRFLHVRYFPDPRPGVADTFG